MNWCVQQIPLSLLTSYLLCHRWNALSQASHDIDIYLFSAHIMYKNMYKNYRYLSVYKMYHYIWNDNVNWISIILLNASWALHLSSTIRINKYCNSLYLFKDLICSLPLCIDLLWKTFWIIWVSVEKCNWKSQWTVQVRLHCCSYLLTHLPTNFPLTLLFLNSLTYIYIHFLIYLSTYLHSGIIRIRSACCSKENLYQGLRPTELQHCVKMLISNG